MLYAKLQELWQAYAEACFDELVNLNHRGLGEQSCAETCRQVRQLVSAAGKRSRKEVRNEQRRTEINIGTAQVVDCKIAQLEAELKITDELLKEATETIGAVVACCTYNSNDDAKIGIYGIDQKHSQE
jgi:hypothetical protein